ncbi:hypothetical protein PSI9734_01918 [Pseudidiomarina piscicola]|uniref:HemY N-terminal domain-containing protein n=1 Tax=Pseudidiomarina piscicola TaxID=2614830 RepID=A0A6S6WVE6_9GAMM|nr:heme biosynthesis HemY N-terminal domain-containing protein [Pseudidiomarina piscicola]CAB0151530.1 hypothetical protein PSI9734_01918 [Pseudidiomarina piscicola]VZT41009.1 hypothetical protein PSI9734_01918 [Pseudomonas aeruginosa]
MKYAWIIVILLIAGLFIGPLWEGNTGYMLIAVGNYTIETSLVAAVIMLVITVILIRVLLAFVMRIVRGTSWGIKWFGQRRTSKAQAALTEGATALVNGDSHAASNAFNRSWQLRHDGTVALFASYAAARNDDYNQAREWLQQAPKPTELSLAGTLFSLQQDPDLAANRIDELQQLRRQYPRHPQLARLALSAYQSLHRWDDVIACLADCERLQLLNSTELTEFTEQAYRESFLASGREGKASLATQWRNLARDKRRNAPIRRAYIAVLKVYQQLDAADKVAARGLKRGTLELAHLLEKQLLVAGPELRDYLQGQLKKHPEDGLLLQAMGQVALVTKEWALAERALRRAAELVPSRRVWLDLAHVYAAQGNSQAALEAYEKALRD